MSREIKFRVWCKDKNEWEKDEVFLSQTGNQFHTRKLSFVKPDNHIIEFFTGLHDKNGKEIYEGDKLIYNFTEKIVISKNEKVACKGFAIIEISFLKGCFCSRIVEQKNYWYDNIPSEYSDIWEKDFKYYEIIGNIHENPELLEAK